MIPSFIQKVRPDLAFHGIGDESLIETISIRYLPSMVRREINRAINKGSCSRLIYDAILFALFIIGRAKGAIIIAPSRAIVAYTQRLFDVPANLLCKTP